MIVCTHEEMVERLFGSNLPAKTAKALGVEDVQFYYQRLHLQQFYNELARLLGTGAPTAPYQWYITFLAAGYSHASEWGMDEPTVRTFQRLMRDVLVPLLVTDQSARTDILRHWDRNFS